MNKKCIILLALCCCLSASAGDYSVLEEHPIQKGKALYEILYAIYLTHPQTSVSGRVILCSLNNSGNPNVKVTLAGMFGARTVYTEDNGNFSFDNVRTSDYTVYAEKEGHQFIPDKQNIQVGIGGLTGINFETSVTWDIKIGGDGWEKIFSAQQTNDCGYIVAGYTDSHNNIGDRDFYIVKLNLYGVIDWQKTYGGTNSDIAYSVKQTSDNGFIACGYTYSYGAGLSDYYIVKLDSTGERTWEQYYGGSESDVAFSIKPTSDNGYIIAGYTESFGAGISDFWVLKIDTNGNYSWGQTYGTIDRDEAYSISEVREGGYIVAGNKQDAEGNYDIWIIRINATGTIIEWEQTYNKGDYDEANEIYQTSDGGFIVSGYTDYNSGECWILKLDADGNVLWEKLYGGGYTDKAYSINQTTDDGYIVAGYTYSYATLDTDMYILKLNSAGDMEWEKTFDGEYQHEDAVRSIQQTSDGGYIVAGFTTTYTNKTDIWLIKLNNTGEVVQ